MENARILCLVDEGAKTGTPLVGSKGSSLLIEADGSKVLFNTGRSGGHLVHNMSHLGIMPDDIDAVVISNASLDCVGGLNNFMTYRKEPITVYSIPEAWDCKRLIGPLISEDNDKRDAKIAGSDWIQLSQHLFVSPIIEGPSMEMAVVLLTKDGAVVLSESASDGVSGMLKTVSARFSDIHAFVGGIRMKKMKQPAVNGIASVLTEEYGIRDLHINGCSSSEGIQKLRVATSNDSIRDFFVGCELVFEL